MSFLHLHILTDSRVAALKAAGHTMGNAIGSSLTTAVTLAAQAGNPIGAAALAAVDMGEASGKPGPEKKIDAVAAVVPVILNEAAKGGLPALEKDAETFAGLVIEEVLSSVKQTPVVAIGEALLRALGVITSRPTPSLPTTAAPAPAPAPEPVAHAA